MRHLKFPQGQWTMRRNRRRNYLLARLADKVRQYNWLQWNGISALGQGVCAVVKVPALNLSFQHDIHARWHLRQRQQEGDGGFYGGFGEPPGRSAYQWFYRSHLQFLNFAVIGVCKACVL